MERKLRVVLYLRLSDEDRDKLTKEQKSESIKNQKQMLTSYALGQSWQIIHIYDDEDWSGADQTRPNFNRMISACRNQEVDIVLVKSQARFARDMEIVEKYVHDKFIEWNVRFVSLMENIDNTKRETKKTSQIIGLTDEWFLEDTSHNIRETLKTKRKNGEYTGSFAPYGYQKDPENKNHLVPDEKVKPYVIRIFEEYNHGYGMEKIAHHLMQDGIYSPLEYKLSTGSRLKLPFFSQNRNPQKITKAGNYVIHIQYYNTSREVLTNLTTLEYFYPQTFYADSELVLSRIKNENTQIYYSEYSLIDLGIQKEHGITLEKAELFNFNDHDRWKPLSLGEKVSKKTTCLAVHTKNLDRMNEIFYEFNLKLKQNPQRLNYDYHLYCISPTTTITKDYQIQIRPQYQWSLATIKKILHDEVYIGNLIQFKTTTVSYKNKKIIYNLEQDKIRVENTHEPLIDQPLWKQVQKKLKLRQKSNKNGKIHLLAGKVFCSCCQSIFYKCGKKDKVGSRYLCCKDKVNKWRNCTNQKYIKESKLQEIVLTHFNFLLQKYYQIDQQLTIHHQEMEKGWLEQEKKRIAKEKKELVEELEKRHTNFQNLYEDLKKDLLDQEEYFFLKKKYREEYEKLNHRYQVLVTKEKKIIKKQTEWQNQKNMFLKYTKVSQLDIEIVNDFIDQILIGQYNPLTNTREIEIIWNFD